MVRHIVRALESTQVKQLWDMGKMACHGLENEIMKQKAKEQAMEDSHYIRDIEEYYRSACCFGARRLARLHYARIC